MQKSYSADLLKSLKLKQPHSVIVNALFVQLKICESVAKMTFQSRLNHVIQINISIQQFVIYEFENGLFNDI